MIQLKDVSLFQGLSEPELREIGTVLHEKEYSKGDTLLSEGNTCDRVFIVRDGRVKLYRMTAEGREQILEMLGPGDTCACNPGTREWFCSASAEALSDCKVWFFSRYQYVRLVEKNTPLSHSLNRIFAERLRCMSSLVEEVSLKDTRKRVVKFLLDMLAHEESKKAARAGELPVPFTREVLAQRLGMARETVARQLHELKHEKLIDIHPHQIVILNRLGLEKLL